MLLKIAVSPRVDTCDGKLVEEMVAARREGHRKGARASACLGSRRRRWPQGAQAQPYMLSGVRRTRLPPYVLGMTRMPAQTSTSERAETRRLKRR